MANYAVRDIVREVIHGPNEYPGQLYRIKNIFPNENRYQLQGVRDNTIINLSKELLDAGWEKTRPFGS
jgi:hypothetical protein